MPLLILSHSLPWLQTAVGDLSDSFSPLSVKAHRCFLVTVTAAPIHMAERCLCLYCVWTREERDRIGLPPPPPLPMAPASRSFYLQRKVMKGGERGSEERKGRAGSVLEIFSLKGQSQLATCPEGSLCRTTGSLGRAKSGAV